MNKIRDLSGQTFGDLLVKEMTEADLREAEFDLLIQKHGHKALRNQN